MPNYCSYDIHARGSKKNLLTLYDWLKAQYDYTAGNTDEIKVWKQGPNNTKIPLDHHIGYRVFETYAYADWLDDDEVVIDDEEEVLYLSGCCAWSVASCIIRDSSGLGYLNQYDNSEAISIEEACGLLNIECEIFSCEPGMMFAEQYYINSKGKIIEEKETEYYEIFIDDDCDTYSGYCQNYLEEYGEEPHITEQEFYKCKDEGNNYIAKCKWFKDGIEEWPWKII